MKRFEDKEGSEYELFLKVSPYYGNLQKTIAKEVRKVRPKSALEIGFGSGHTTAAVIKANPSLKITAVDSSQVMVKQAKESLCKQISAKKVKLVFEDALVFLRKCKNNQFDVFYSGLTLHNIEKGKRKLILQQIYRVLKEEGLFVNGDKYARDSPKDQKRELDWQIKKFNIFEKLGRADLKKIWKEHYLIDENSYLIMKETKSKKEMKSLGFESIKVVFRKHMEAVLIAKKALENI